MAFMKFYVGNEANASSHRDGIYIAVDTKKIFYNGSAYGGSEVDLSNYYTIAQVNGKIGTNVYTGANYISKETNLTDAVLQLDVEIDNLALEHANAEATYAKKTELGGYLPLSGGELSGSLYITGSSQLQLIGIGGNLFFRDTEGKMMVSIETMSDRTPVGGHGAYGTIHCRYTDGSSKSTLSPGGLTLETGGESISVSPSGISKNGGSPTKVFATDGSIADLIPVNKIKVKLNLGYDESVIEAITAYISNNINAYVNNFSASVLNYIIFTLEYGDKLITVGHVLLHVEKGVGYADDFAYSGAGGIGLIMDGYTNPDTDIHTIGFTRSGFYNIGIDASVTGQNTEITVIA